jgi:hypothetical protein
MYVNLIVKSLTAAPNNARIIESRRNRWAGHVASMGGMRYVYKILVRKLGKDYMEDLSIDGRIVLGWILGK